MTVLQRSEFCSDLASVGNVIPSDSLFVSYYSEILFQMANSYIWRPYLLLDQWRSLEFLSTRCTYLEPLDRCLLNEALIPSLSQMGDEIVKSWLKVVWRQSFETLPPNLLAQIRAATLGVFSREGEAAVEEFKALIDFDQNELGTLMDSARLESVRRRQSIFQELYEEAQNMFDGDFADSPIGFV